MDIDNIPDRVYWCDWGGHKIQDGEPMFYVADEDMRLCEACAKKYAWNEFMKRAVQITAGEE